MTVVDKQPYKPKTRSTAGRAKGGPGSPDLVWESLPDDPKDEEFAILEKFISGLAHFEHRDISGLYREGDAWPDFEKGKGAQKLGIEISWVANEAHDHLRRVQPHYVRRVAELLEVDRSKLAGLNFQLDDAYQEPRYPRLESREGQAIAKAIAALIRSKIDEFKTLPVWTDAERPPVTYRVVEPGPAGVVIGYSVFRFAEADSARAPIIRFFGSFPTKNDLLNSLVWRAIERKLKKNYDYTSYPGRLWLLVWGGMEVSGAEPTAAASYARNELSTMTSQPFDEIWFVSPIPGASYGWVEHIWPP